MSLDAPPPAAAPAAASPSLEGQWTVERVSGLLPPMAGVRKTIRGAEGETRVAGLLRLPFTVSRGPGAAARILYRAPLAMIADELTAAGDGEWSGVSKVAGIPVGRFRMRRP